MRHILHNPAWEALGSRQAHFNEGNAVMRWFPADVSPFVGLNQWDAASQGSLLREMPAHRTFSVMTAEQVKLREEWDIVVSIPLYQMVCEAFKPYRNKDAQIRELTVADVPKMLDLTARTKPGPFFQRTIGMGSYFGLFDGDTLASMAGERLKLTGYTEVSAICTEPAYLGKGYASAVTSVVCEKIISEGNTPFLHVRADNTRAIDVYKKLGFGVRADVFFAVIRTLRTNP